jgi:hypothetical protein
VGDGEIDAQDLAIAHLARIELDLDGFGMAGGLGADHFVMRGGGSTAGIARQHLLHALHMLEHALHAPEAAARQHRGLASAHTRLVDQRRGNGFGRLLGAGGQGEKRERRAEAQQIDAHVFGFLQAFARGTNFIAAEFMQ